MLFAESARRRHVIIGAGGHSRAVVSAAGSRFAIFDDALENQTTNDLLKHARDYDSFHVAIGSNEDRRKIYQKCRVVGDYISWIHPLAIIDSSAIVEDGVYVGPGAIIGPNVKICRGCIINSGAIIEHDSEVGEFSHIAPRATLLGGVLVSRLILVGANAVVLPKTKVTKFVKAQSICNS